MQLFTSLKKFGAVAPVVPECFYREHSHFTNTGFPTKIFGNDKQLKCTLFTGVLY